MSQSHEPSYYEIALTNRQVFAVFVVLLLCVLAAFLSGVWIGQRGEAQTVEEVIADVEGARAGEEAGGEVQRLHFFSDEDGEPQRPEEKGGTEQKGSDKDAVERAGGDFEPAEERVLEKVEEAPAARPQPEAPAPQIIPPPEPPARREVSAPPESGELVIQVFSSRDVDQAQSVVQRLVAGGYNAFLSPVDVAGQTMYRVRIGPFSEREQAESVAERVRRRFKLDTWITR